LRPDVIINPDGFRFFIDLSSAGQFCNEWLIIYHETPRLQDFSHTLVISLYQRLRAFAADSWNI